MSPLLSTLLSGFTPFDTSLYFSVNLVFALEDTEFSSSVNNPILLKDSDIESIELLKESTAAFLRLLKVSSTYARIYPSSMYPLIKDTTNLENVLFFFKGSTKES